MIWFAASYGGAVLGFLGVNAAAGRWLGPSDFGFFVGALAAAGLLSQIGLVGSHRSGLREVSRLRDTEDPEAMAVLRNGVRAVCLTSLPLAGALGAAGAWYLSGDLDLNSRIGLVVALALLVVLGGQQQLWANYVRGLGHVRFASMLEGRSGGALVAGLQAASVVAAWQLSPRTGLPGALAAMALGLVIPVVASRAVVRRRWRGLGGPGASLWRDLRKIVRRDWRFLSAQVATYLNVSLEIWIAGLLLASVDASMFSAGQRLALMLMLPLTAMQVVFAPVVARHGVGGRDLVSLQRLLRAGASVATVLSLMLALPLLVAPGWVLRLVYGVGFSDAIPVLLLLSVAAIGNVASGMAGTTLSMLGREEIAAQVQWTGAILRVALGVPAALTLGITGLTVSALFTSTLVFTVMWWRTRRALGISTQATFRPDLSLLRRTSG